MIKSSSFEVIADAMKSSMKKSSSLELNVDARTYLMRKSSVSADAIMHA